MSDWDDLRVFLAVCREGSVNRAGTHLGISHTTVLRRIKAFEQSLGTRLFDRTRAGYAMTPAAESMRSHAEAMETEFRAVRRKADGLDRRLAGSVRITAPHEIASGMLVPELPTFRRTFPGIDLTLVETLATLDLDAREAELAVRITQRPPEDLIGRRVHPVVQAVYGPRSGQTPSDLILYRQEPLRSGWTDRFPNAAVGLRTDSPTTMMRAAVAGVGLARLPCYMADNEPGLVRIGPLLEPDGWAIWVLTHPDVRTSARVRACREFVIDALEARRALIRGE